MDQMLTTREACTALSVSRATLWRMVKRGELPEPQRYNSRLIRWPADKVEAAKAAHRPPQS